MRIRLLPVVIFGAALLLGVRVTGMWDELSVGGVPAATAEEKKKAPAKKPAARKSKSAKAAKTKPSKAKAGAGKTAKKAKGGAGKPPKSVSKSMRQKPRPDINEYDLSLLQDLAKRRRLLEKRERAIAMREGMLKAIEKRVEQKLAQLKKIQASIKTDLKQAQKNRGQRYAKLIKIYSNMKPAEAARVFDELDLPIVIDLLGGMKESASAPILAAMDPKKVRRITAGLVKAGPAKPTTPRRVR